MRLAHVRLRTAEGAASSAARADERRAVEESATVLPFDGGPTEQAVRTQEVQVVAPDPGVPEADGPGTWRVLAPVTERGEVIGLLELILPEEPARGVDVARSRGWRTCWRSW